MRLLLLVVCLGLVGCAEPSDAPAAPGTPATPAAPAPDTRFPDTLAGLERRSVATTTDAALGESVTETIALYGAENSTGEPSLEVYRTDYGTSEMAEMMGLGWALRDETDFAAGTTVQASEAFDGHPARRTWDSEIQKGRLQVLADGTLFVEVRAENVTEDALDAAARVALSAP